MREQFKDSPHYEYCAQFCHLYDQAAFDPEYESEPLEFFEPMVQQVFGRKAYDPDIIRAGVTLGLPPLNS